MVQEKAVTPITVVAGPTGSGKSALAVELALAGNGGIISCDSMQIYKYMDIGTAKTTKHERKGTEHFMIDVCLPDCDYSVSLFCDGADEAASELYKKGKAVIAAGGTGLYIKAFLYEHSLGNSAKDESIRAEYGAMLAEKGKEYIYALLAEKDPGAAARLHVNDTKRVIRALEIARSGGGTKSEIIDIDKKTEAPRYPYKMFILDMERDKLYKRINGRVDKMIKDGLIEETEGLLKIGYHAGLNSMKAIGYAEIIRYLQGGLSREDAIELIKQNTRRYAKRQITFFKGFKDAVWLDAGKDIKTLVNEVSWERGGIGLYGCKSFY